MADTKQQENLNQQEENGENVEQEQKQEQLSQTDKKVYEQIFSSLNKMDKKVKTAKSKLNNNDSEKKQSNNTAYKQIAQKLIQSKQNSQIITKEDLSSDINQSFQRTVIDIYSENQKLKKKQIQMEKIIRDQNHKIYEQQTKQQNYIKEIEKLQFQLAQTKDKNLMANRQPVRTEPQTQNKKQSGKKGIGKYESSQNNEDYDFWNTPQNDNNYAKKKKQFVQNSGLWVNQKNVNDSMFITEGRR